MLLKEKEWQKKEGTNMGKKQITPEAAEAINEAVVDAINEALSETTEEVVPTQAVVNIPLNIAPEEPTQVGHSTRAFRQ